MFGWFKQNRHKPEAEAPSVLPLHAEQLQPRIRHIRFKQALLERGIPPEQCPVTRPLVGELLVAYGFDLGEQFIMAGPIQLQQAGLNAEEAHAHAIRNLAQCASEPQRYSNGESMALVTGGELEACLLLLPGLWDTLEEELGIPLRVAVPRRDCIVVALHDGKCGEDALHQAIADFFDPSETHALSSQILRWHHHAWMLAH